MNLRFWLRARIGPTGREGASEAVCLDSSGLWRNPFHPPVAVFILKGYLQGEFLWSPRVEAAPELAGHERNGLVTVG